MDDLIALLQDMGADVERTAPDVIEVEGRRRLRGATTGSWPTASRPARSWSRPPSRAAR